MAPPRTMFYHREPSPFGMSSFQQSWWKHMAPKFDILESHGSLVIHRKKAPAGLSLREMRLAGWNTAWSQNFTRNEWQTLQQVKDLANWDYFRMSWRKSRQTDQAFDQLRWLGLKPIQLTGSPVYLIDLVSGFESYLAKLSRSKRRDIRRNLKAIEHLEPRFERFEGKAGIATFFRQFFEHHIPYWQQKTGHAYFSDPRERAFILDWANSLEQQGHLLLEGFYLNNQLTNLTMNILVDHTLYSMLTINTGPYPEYAPGLTSLYYRMQHAWEYDIHRIDMGSGDYGYKPGISNLQDPQYSIVFANPNSPQGMVYVHWLKNKAALAMLPHALSSPKQRLLPVAKFSIESPLLHYFGQGQPLFHMLRPMLLC